MSNLISLQDSNLTWNQFRTKREPWFWKEEAALVAGLENKTEDYKVKSERYSIFVFCPTSNSTFF